MGLSLVKTTSNNVSGTYSPNGLLSGYFEVTLVGDTQFLAPTNIGDGTFWALKVISGVEGPFQISWGSNYAGNFSPIGSYDTVGSATINMFLRTGGLDVCFWSLGVA